MPRGTRSPSFLDTQISIGDTLKVGFDLMLGGFFLKLIQMAVFYILNLQG